MQGKMSNNGETQNYILDSSEIDNSSHVVLSNISTPNDKLRRRSTKRTSKTNMSKQRRVQAPPKSPKRIPQWLWIIIAKSLGIKTSPNEKPVLSGILYFITLASAGLMFVTQVLFNGYDIASEMTKTDILDGFAVILMELLYIGLGIYAHRLAYRLFMHPKFREMMRLHAKTIFKLNAAIVVFIILTVFVIVVNINTVDFMYFEIQTTENQSKVGLSNKTIDYYTQQNYSSTMNPCQIVNIPLTICHVYFMSQAIFSLFFLIWNGIVAVILVSVARTHTINIRKFICQLECDAYLIDTKFRQMFYSDNSSEAKDSLKEYVWMDSDHLADLMRDSDENQEVLQTTTHNNSSQSDKRAENGGSEEIAIREQIDDDEPTFYNDSTKIELQLQESSGQQGLRESGMTSNRNGIQDKMKSKRIFGRSMSSTVFGRFHRLSETLDGGNDGNEIFEEAVYEPHVMSEEEIMHKYWKIATSTRLTSQAFQRWMSIMTAAIMFWSVTLIVKWLIKTPTISGVLSFIFPLLMLPLLASSYAEVNFEGVRVLQSIMPKEDRTAMFRYLYGLPIQLTAYGHPISYKTMGTVLVAILAAFLSKILLKSMNFLVNQ